MHSLSKRMGLRDLDIPKNVNGKIKIQNLAN